MMAERVKGGAEIRSICQGHKKSGALGGEAPLYLKGLLREEVQLPNRYRAAFREEVKDRRRDARFSGRRKSCHHLDFNVSANAALQQ